MEQAELNVLLFSLLKATMRVPPGCWIAPVGPEWMGTFILGSTCTSFFIVLHIARFMPKPSVCWLLVLKLYRTFTAAGGSLKSSFLWNLKDLFKYIIYAESSGKQLCLPLHYSSSTANNVEFLFYTNNFDKRKGFMAIVFNCSCYCGHHCWGEALEKKSDFIGKTMT